MEVKGVLLQKYDTATFGTSGFKKREFVLEIAENPDYPEMVKFELIQDKCELLDGLRLGQDVNIHFNLKGRKWTNPKGEDVYFNSLQAWKISAGSKEAHQQTETSDEIDDLPF